MSHIAGTSICISPARASVAVPTIVQSELMDGHVMQRQELTARVSVHTPPSDRRPKQVPLALSKPPQHRGLHQDSPPRGRTSPVHTTTHVTAPRTLGYTLRRHHESPNCRTWSILRWFPKPGAPKPVRGRSEEQVWGLPGLTPRDQEDVDNDSTLLLRQMCLTSLAYQGVASQTIPHCPGSFLEHPSDPKETSKSPNAHRCSTIWNTKAYQHWAKTLRHRQVKFDQCQLGQLVAKSTTLSTDWTGMICDHPGHPKLADIASSDLSRYPWKMMKGLAQAIAIRARPILQNPTPGLQVTIQFELGQHQPMKRGRFPFTDTVDVHFPEFTGRDDTRAHHIGNPIQPCHTGAAGPEWKRITGDTQS